MDLPLSFESQELISSLIGNFDMWSFHGIAILDVAMDHR